MKCVNQNINKIIDTQDKFNTQIFSGKARTLNDYMFKLEEDCIIQSDNDKVKEYSENMNTALNGLKNRQNLDKKNKELNDQFNNNKKLLNETQKIELGHNNKHRVLIIGTGKTLYIKCLNFNIRRGSKLVIEPNAKLVINGRGDSSCWGKINLEGELINYGEIINECKLIFHKGSEFINISNSLGSSGNIINKRISQLDSSGNIIGPGPFPEMIEVNNTTIKEFMRNGYVITQPLLVHNLSNFGTSLGIKEENIPVSKIREDNLLVIINTVDLPKNDLKFIMNDLNVSIPDSVTKTGQGSQGITKDDN